MAISLKTAGAWARMVTDGGTVAIPGTPAAGDRMFLFGSWKTYTITVATPNGWNLVSDFSDGTVAAGNGTGSVHNAVYYRDWQSGDAAPAIDYSAAPTEGHWVIMLWQKAGGDTWAPPSAVTAAITAVDPWAATASATITVPDAGVVMSLVGFRDDLVTIARGTADIGDDASPAVSWNGNYVESPATHFTSTTGLDMAGDLGHRFVTTGAAGVSLTTAGDPSAAETGSATWIVQGLSVPVTGTGGVTFAAPAAGATGKETISGSGGVVVTAPAAAATAKEAMTATGGVDLDAPAVSGTGTVTSTGVTGTGAIAFAAPAVTVTAKETITGTAALGIAAPAIAGTGKEAITGTGAIAFLAPTLDGTGLVVLPVTGTAAITIAAPSLSGTGIGGEEDEDDTPAVPGANARAHASPPGPQSLPPTAHPPVNPPRYTPWVQPRWRR